MPATVGKWALGGAAAFALVDAVKSFLDKRKSKTSKKAEDGAQSVFGGSSLLKESQTNITESVDVPHEPVLRQDDRGAYPFPNMNPGNLRYFGVGWHGEIPDGLRYGDFTHFDSATNGLRAMIRNAIRMPERGVIPDLTIRDFVHVATPGIDGNDEQQHAQNIADVSGLGVDDVLDTNDDGTMVDFARGVVQAESTARAADWFTPEEYTNAVRAARVDM